MKLCTKCVSYKSYSDFNKDSSKIDKLYSSCKECVKLRGLKYKEKISSYSAEYRKHHKEQQRISTKKGLLRRYYGLTLEQYEKMLIDTPLCSICHRKFNESLPAEIDHNHITGKVRNLLCHKCNTTLGFLETSPAPLSYYLNYLEAHKCPLPNP